MERKKLVGIGLIVAGVAIVVLMLLADYIGIGYPEHGFGRGQKLGTFTGVVIIGFGSLLAFKKKSDDSY